MRELNELADDGRPRILGIKLGVNPNSSSLGVDVSFLLVGGTATIAASLVLGALLRGRRLLGGAPVVVGSGQGTERK